MAARRREAAVRGGIDLACVVEGCLFLSGWLRAAAEDRVLAVSAEGDGYSLPLTGAWRCVAQETRARFLIAAVLDVLPPLRLRFHLLDAGAVCLAVPPASGVAALRGLVARQGASLAALIEAQPGAERRRLRAALDALAPRPAPRPAMERMETIDPALRLEITLCAALGERLLLLGELADPAGALRSADLCDAAGVPLPAGWIAQPEGLGEGPAAGAFIAVLPRTAGMLRLAGSRALWHLPLRAEAGGEVPRRIAAFLAAADADTGLAVLEALGEDAAAPPLRHAWAALIARLPAALDRADLGLRLCIDAAIGIPGVGVFLRGWMAGAPGGVTLRAAGGARTPLAGCWLRQPRADVAQAMRQAGESLAEAEPGFLCLAASPAAGPHYLAIEAGAAGVLRLCLPASSPAPIRTILTSFAPDHRRLSALLDRHVGPAVAALWAARPPSPAPLPEWHGTPPVRPLVSLIVPLYGRCDFIEHQLAQFVDDAELHRCELIYVVDDPALIEPARRLAAELARFYRLPLLLAYGQGNVGYAGACNLGAGLARAAHLLLLNSDVLPDRPGWLGALHAAYRRLPTPGVVAPRLLFEDGSLQHAGMRLVRQPGGLWANTHPGKGLPDTGSGPAQEFAVLSGACLLIARSLYRQVGGLSEDYILGDFEDSDLCLALRRLGRRNWLLPSVALYHLERQSQNAIGDAAWRAGVTLYNAWRHGRRWAADIAGLDP